MGENIPEYIVASYPGIERFIERFQHIGHKHHLCDLAKSGETTLSQMKKLVKNPQFICTKCGRAATNEENLCDPTPLS